ncbi:MAG: DUF4402 domain-containing protein, partial [Bacteroidota bacterium]
MHAMVAVPLTVQTIDGDIQFPTCLMRNATNVTVEPTDGANAAEIEVTGDESDYIVLSHTPLVLTHVSNSPQEAPSGQATSIDAEVLAQTNSTHGTINSPYPWMNGTPGDGVGGPQYVELGASSPAGSTGNGTLNVKLGAKIPVIAANQQRGNYTGSFTVTAD